MNEWALPIVVVAVVAGLALWLRAASKGQASTSPLEGGRVQPARLAAAPYGAEEDDDDDNGDEDSPDDDQPTQVPISSEGVAFVPRRHGVLLLSVAGRGEVPDWLDRATESNYVPGSVLNQLYYPGAGGGVQQSWPGTALHVGDLTGARLVAGTPGADAWRLETLGRDGDYGFHPFTTRAAAEEALDMLVKRGVVHRPEDPEDHSIPASPEDFEEARRRYEETASDLAIDADGEEPPREGPWVSDRR